MMIRATSEWWDGMEAMYRRSNDLLEVDLAFTDLVVKDPTFRTHMWLMVYEGCLVGMLRQVHSEVSCVTVDPDRRRQGWGRRMMEDLRKKDEPFNLECFGTNHVALDFYRSLPWLKEGATIEHTSRSKKISYALVNFKFHPQRGDTT